jgi:hypothetical protein
MKGKSPGVLGVTTQWMACTRTQKNIQECAADRTYNSWMEALAQMYSEFEPDDQSRQNFRYSTDMDWHGALS